MPPGGRCPQCNFYLRIKDERWEQRGVTVWYECAKLTCNYAVKKFIESQPR